MSPPIYDTDELTDRPHGIYHRQRVRTATFTLILFVERLRLTISPLRCNDLRAKITQLTDGEYAIAKNDVDRLRQELGQPPLPSLQNALDDKASQ